MHYSSLSEKGTHVTLTPVKRLNDKPGMLLVTHIHIYIPKSNECKVPLLSRRGFHAPSRERMDYAAKDIGRLLHLRTESLTLARFNRNRVL